MTMNLGYAFQTGVRYSLNILEWKDGSDAPRILTPRYMIIEELETELAKI